MKTIAQFIRFIMPNMMPVVLALVVVLTAQQMAAARGQMRVAGVFVMCTGAGVVTVTLDENGDPTGPAHVCPDCVVGFFADAGGDTPDISLTSLESKFGFRAQTAQLSVDKTCPAARPRGPPMVV